MYCMCHSVPSCGYYKLYKLDCTALNVNWNSSFLLYLSQHWQPRQSPIGWCLVNFALPCILSVSSFLLMSAARGVFKGYQNVLETPTVLTLNSDLTFIPGWNMQKGEYADSILGLQSITVLMAKKKATQHKKVWESVCVSLTFLLQSGIRSLTLSGSASLGTAKRRWAWEGQADLPLKGPVITHYPLTFPQWHISHSSPAHPGCRAWQSHNVLRPVTSNTTVLLTF